MPTITLNQELRTEYTSLFNTCTLKPAHSTAINRLVDRILSKQERYQSVSAITGVPWYVIAAIHAMESSLRFDRHLHNGDPLHSKTTHVPANRPPGNPPFTWEASCIDALRFDGMAGWGDWSLSGTLFKLESYNGWGYRKYHADVLSPYLWSFSTHYTKGKYARDGHFDQNLISKQCGVATLLKAFESRGIAVFEDESSDFHPTDVQRPLYPGRLIRQGEDDSIIVKQIQLRLNELGCSTPPLVIDGDFGSNTEGAVRVFQARSEDNSGDELVIDGIVGSLTWEALFGEATIPHARIRPSQVPLLAKVLDIARKEIGVLEDPIGSNRGQRVEEYLASTGLEGGFPWCAAFVYWCFEQAAKEINIDNPCIQTAGVLDHWNRAGREGIRRITHDQAEADPQLVQPGMIFIIDTGTPGGAGHTGLIERIDGGKLITIEGNTNKRGGREGIGVFKRNKRKVRSINKGFIDYSRGMSSKG